MGAAIGLGQQHPRVEAVVREPSRVQRGHTQPEIYRHITAFLARRLRDVDDALTATSFLPLKARTARALLSLSDAFGKEIGSGRVLIRQKFSQSDLAAMAGIARENCSRILQ